MTEPAPLRVLRVYRSAVVTMWREREVALGAEGIDVATVAARQWDEGGELVSLEVGNDECVTGVRTFGSHPFLFIYDPIGLWRALRKHRHVDVLDIHEEPAALAMVEVFLLARLAGCRAPVVCYSAQNILKRYPPPFRWFERFVLGRVTTVHSCNEEVADVLGAKGYTGEVVNLGLGVDLEHFAPATSNGQAKNRREQPFRVGYVGRFTKQKGIFTLLSTISLLHDAECVFVGAGPDEARLRQAIRVRGLDDRVRIQGFVAHDELPDLYRSFDTVVVPSIDQQSWKEQFGRVPVEAMACGTPVVVSDGGSLPEVVADAGIVVSQNDAQALADALVSLQDAPDRRHELATAGIQRASYFSWERIAHDQAVVYRNVAG